MLIAEMLVIFSSNFMFNGYAVSGGKDQMCNNKPFVIFSKNSA